VPLGVGGTVEGLLSDFPVSDRVRGLFRVRREIGSNEMTRGLGSAIGATSMTSRRVTLVSQVVVGDIVVGRVNVEVNM
jgi:hypothetical protein